MSCTGADAYAAHIRGAKHQKVGVFSHTSLCLTLFSFTFSMEGLNIGVFKT